MLNNKVHELSEDITALIRENKRFCIFLEPVKTNEYDNSSTEAFFDHINQEATDN
jgi:hypothetical protein